MEKPTPSESVMLSEIADAGDAGSLRSVRLRSTLTLDQDSEAGQHSAQGLAQHKLTAKPLLNNHLKKISTQNLAKVPPNIPPDMKKEGFWKSSLKLLFPRENVQQSKGGSQSAEKNKLFHFELLGSPAFLAFCLSIGIFTATFKSTFTFMPALAKSRGLTNSEAVLVLSIAGAVDTLGRIVAGFLMDMPAVRRHRLTVYGFVQLVTSSLCVLMPLVGSSFKWLCVICSLFGLMTGLLVSQKSVLCVDLLGAKLMPSAFGILLLFQAVGIGVGPLLAGLCFILSPLILQ